jgi:cytochrome c oxidase cbb3-type subunit 3
MRLACLTLAAVLPVAAQTNQFTSASDIALGKATFEGRCAGCHGQSGEGGRGPAINTGTFRHGGADREIFHTIRNGIPNSEMPPLFNQTDPEVWRIVAYVRTLASRGARIDSGTADPAAGAAVYAARGCASCHLIAGKGSDLGPDLSRAGVRAPRFLRDSIVTPSADLPLQYLAVTVVTNAGVKIRGIFLNEDDYSIQLRDTAGNPRSFLKNTLKEFQHDRESLMPAYASLAARDLDNLVAYLGSLK